MPPVCCDVVGVLFEVVKRKEQTVYGQIIMKYECMRENVTSHTHHPPTKNLLLKPWAHVPSLDRCLLLNTNVDIPTVIAFAG